MRLIYLLLILTIPFKVSAQIKPADQQYIPQENLLLNPGYEQGRVNWTISGTATVSLEQTASAVLAGLSSLKIVASSQTFEVAQFTTKSAASLNGMQAMASVRVKTNQSGVQVCSIENSVHVKCVNVDSTNQTKEYIIPFVFNSTNNGIVIKGASGTGTTYIDDAYVGIMPATMMPEISQAQILSFSQYGASCTFSRTATGYADFANITACDSTPKDISSNYSGALALTDTDNTSFTLNNMPIGHYEITANVAYFESDATAEVGCFRISDGTLFGSGTCQLDDNTIATNGVAKWSFYLDTASSKTIRIQGTDLSSLVFTDAQNRRLSWNIKYYPPKSKIYSGDTIYPHAQLYGKLNYATAANCIWSITGTTIANFGADTDCANPTVTGGVLAPAAKIPAVVLPAGSPKGTYKFVASGAFYAAATSNALCGYRLSDGTRSTTLSYIGNNGTTSAFSPNILGEIEYSSNLTSNTTVQIQAREFDGNAARCDVEAQAGQEELTISVYYFPPKDNPIIGTFEGIEKCEDDYECTDTFSARIDGSVSPSTVTKENIDWIVGDCTRVASGNFDCTVPSGLFTTVPNCIGTRDSTAGATWGVTFDTANSTTTNLKFRLINEAGTGFNSAFYVMCQKQGSDYKPKTAKAATTNEMMYVPNVTRPKTCYYAFGGASATLASPTVCAASPCVEVYDSCSAVTPPTRSGTGDYFDLTFANGTWKANTYINCRCMAYRTTSIETNDCSFLFATGDSTWMTNASGGAVFNLNTADRTGVNRDGYMSIECTADAP